jgi:shikimate kinase/3-dehydroquinate synthase
MQRPLLLTGFMATGKSTLAERVAARAGRPFVDLDRRIEAQAGSSVAELFRVQGEAHFRALERAALEQVLAARDAPVVALGGGALLHRPTRLRALHQAVVISLQADSAEIARRIAAAGPTRPLANAEARESLEILLAQREEAYAEAHARLSTDTLSVDDAAAQALAIWQRDPIAVAAGRASYAVEVTRGGCSEWLKRMLPGGPHTLLISDENVMRLFGGGVRQQVEQLCPRAGTLTLSPGEQHKNPQTLEQIWRYCLQQGADRQSVFLGLGGGVVTDITGFAAATWMRGVSWFALPTTLLAMVDASVGGKTAVDLADAKNAVGAFHQPKGVLCDAEHLQSEPLRGYRSALAEVVKTALIGDPTLLDLLEAHSDALLARDATIVTQVVRRCIAVKADVVSRDERESGPRAALNLGHTFGHALEAHGGYGTLTHGEAVSLGLVAALRLGQSRQITPSAVVERVVTLLGRLGLPIDPQAHGLSAAAQRVGYDKKRAGAQLRFAFVAEPGKVILESVPITMLHSFASNYS